MKKVLVTGGAGYIGSVLVRLLLAQDYSVVVVDNLSFGGESIVELLNDPRFTFIKGDIRDAALMEEVLTGIDYVAHLAAIVGDPACAKEPELTKSINLDGAKQLYDIAQKVGVKRFIFASTCSNYGKMDDEAGYVNEESPLAPVSLYAETKVAFEQFLLSQKGSGTACIPTCLRFSTVYGLSPRLRFDLTVNEFAKELALGRELVIFGEQFWRPYCHVVDLSRSVIEVFNAEQDKVAFEVFNVGNTEENYQKKMIVDEILKFLPDAKIKYVQRQEDPRDYRVNCDKIANVLNFKITKTVPDGIEQILQVVKDGFIVNPDDGRYKNI
ncbi:NAD(P)-dependent oxidoreductase [Paraneptunicella aestuarii]|uniref:NAD-dependent epimerase/dehydratase family protein n=1 Tax=Paraneptunicella aestuarii TaxID=2831148 RepID=UPI001E35319C|nr:NAD(P)-dependent oxidoreductase [Paraneptunicella aestuarii]UAA39148.1 NAD(P)-dependent oxidoreductase [Paraneptunicella aestuarii]